MTQQYPDILKKSVDSGNWKCLLLSLPRFKYCCRTTV